MRPVNDVYTIPPELVLGARLNSRVPEADQKRQRTEVAEILSRLRDQPGVILADEVGMGKTYVALAVAYTVAMRSPRGPAIVMAPPNLVDKWEQDLKTFSDLYLDGRRPLNRDRATRKELLDPATIRYGVARHSVELLKLLDDAPKERCHLIFLAQGAMARRQSDKWIRLALIAEALRRHATGKAWRLIAVKKSIHYFMAELLWAIGEQRSHEEGEDLWRTLLVSDPGHWKEKYNSLMRSERRKMTDDPVPLGVQRALLKVDLKPLAEALATMPIRATGTKERVSVRVDASRKVLRECEKSLWKYILSRTRWRSPLLIMDEAHHLKNPGTMLARQLQSPDTDHDLKTGDGAMARAFDRMLFLTATPFQLGHRELVHVLRRFGDVRWDPKELGDPALLETRLTELDFCLTESQRTAVALQRSWSRLRPEDITGDVEQWWRDLVASPRENLSGHQRSVLDAFEVARNSRVTAEKMLRPWIVRHNKGEHWVGTGIQRRRRLEGAAIAEGTTATGLIVPRDQLLPFFLAARAAVRPGKDLLGEALCSSYEAFRLTRQERRAAKDEQDEPDVLEELSHSGWYLEQFDESLRMASRSTHPKIAATVKRVADLWERGEKVLVFAFYVHTCRALRLHISQELESRIMVAGERMLLARGLAGGRDEVSARLEKVQNRYFDDSDGPGRRAIDRALDRIIDERESALGASVFTTDQRDLLRDVMRRFLRVATTLVRCFPLADLDTLEVDEAVRQTLDHTDASEVSWRRKLGDFVEFLTTQCSPDERSAYLDAAHRTQTRGIRVAGEDGEDTDRDTTVTLANVQMAVGETKREQRSRLMRAFNTPFFPDILVCSEVMGEGVDLQRFCRHVIHHDLAWNPSTIEQRTGRIDRLGCKAEGRQSIVVYLPYLAGTADERQYRVMTDREKWFRVVMGQEEVARLITSDSEEMCPLPEGVSGELGFELGVEGQHG